MKKNEKILKIIFFSSLALFIILLVIYFWTAKTTKKAIPKPTPTPTPIEVVKARTETTKTFKNYDGSYTNISSLGLVHYKDENGEWKDIDTTITTSSKPGFAYEVTTNNIKTYFKETLNESDYLQIVDEDKIINQGITKQQEDLGEINFSKAVVSKNIITYPEISPGIDLRYTVSDIQILEEFIVKNKDPLSKINSFTQNLTYINLAFNKRDDGSISLSENFNLPKPLMYELGNQDNPNYDLFYKETQLSQNQFQLKKVIKPEGKNWLLDNKRQYPLVIDGTIVYSEAAGTDDAVSRDQQQSYFVNNADPLKTGLTAANVWLGAGFRFAPNIPRGATISDAHLTLKIHTGGQGSGPKYYVAAENVDSCSVWSPTPSMAPGDRFKYYATGAVAQLSRTYSGDAHTSYDFNNISTAVGTVTSRAGWAAGNNLCVFLDWDQFDYTIYFDSFEDPTASYRPTFSVTFTIAPPTNVSATTNLSDKVRISWTNATNITRYAVYRTPVAHTLVGTVTSGSYLDDFGATAPVLNAPSNITASTTDKDKVIVTVGTAGTETHTSYDYCVTSCTTDFVLCSLCPDPEVVGYRTYGAVSGYNIYYGTGGACGTLLATNQASPYNDTSAAAPTLTEPSGLTTSTTTGGGSTCTTIRLTIGTPGVSTNGTSRVYQLKTYAGAGNLSSCTADTAAGYRSYGSVSGYNIYNNADSSLIATNQTSPYNDTTAPTPVMVAKITPSAGTYATKINFNTTTGITPGARAYNAQTCANAAPTPVCTNLSVTSAPSANGNTTGSVTNYYFQVADTSSSTVYGDIANNVTVPYDWTGCSLDIHGWYRTYYTITGDCSSPYSHTTGGVEGYCTNPTAPKNFLMEGVQFTGVKIAP